MSEETGTPVSPKIVVKEHFVVVDGDKEIPLEDVPAYYKTSIEGFRIPVKVVERIGSSYKIRPVYGEGELLVPEHKIFIDLAEYYA